MCVCGAALLVLRLQAADLVRQTGLAATLGGDLCGQRCCLGLLEVWGL